MAAKNTLQFFLGPLLKKFFQDMGRDPNNLEMIILRQKAGQLLKDSNKVINFPQKESFMKQVEAMKRSGDIVDPNNLKKNDNVLTRDMFQNSNLNKVAFDRDRAIKAKSRIEEKKEETIMDRINNAMNRIDEIKKEQADMYRPKTDAEIKAKYDKQNKESIQKFKDKMKKDEPEDKADGGRIGFRAGKFVLDKIVAKLLGDPKKVKQAVDDIFPTGDYKYDAQMAADALVENNPRIFKNKLYEDLDLDTQMEIYGAVLGPIQKNMSMAIKMKKASRPEKTLAAMKEGKGIDMSDPDIADEFTRFMKETDPQGSKTIEQTVELANFDPKKVKGNAEGGRIGYSLGSMVSQARQDSDGIESRLEQLGGDVTSAEQMLQQINERLESAGSSIPEGGGGLGTLATLAGSNQPFNPMQTPPESLPVVQPRPGPFMGRPALTEMPGYQGPLSSPTFVGELKSVQPGDPGYRAPGPTILNEISGFAGETFNQVPEEFKSGYADYMKDKPIQMGGQAMSSVALPDGNRVMFGDTGSAGAFRDYLKSTGFTPPSPLGQPLQSPLQTASSQQNMQKALPGLFAKGGRAGFYTGGITDIEPDLSDIGHGSDSLMARTRLVSPDGQATTSTGLNYLLAEDNDNIRIPFSAGGGGRRAFLKLLASIGGLTAAAKSGILGLGEGGAKKAVTETVKQSAGNYPPPYFFKLVEKIKFMGDDVTEKAATKDREIVKRYKDFEMTEDVATGDIVIKKRNEGSFYDQDGIISDEYIVYKPGMADETTKGRKPPPEYDEYTVRPDADGKLRDSEDGLDSIDEILEEVGDPDSMTLKKADGGRIGFSGGGIFRAIIAKSAARAGMKPYEYIKATSYKSLPPEVKMFMSKADFEKLKLGQEQMYSNYIDMAKTRKEFQKNIEGGKNTPARELFEGMEKTMDEQSFVPKTVTDKDIGEMELMVKNRFNKGRKDNANGGIQTMLGE